MFPSYWDITKHLTKNINRVQLSSKVLLHEAVWNSFIESRGVEMYRTLTPEGRPIRPNSFFVSIRREVIRPVDFLEHLSTGKEFALPVRQCSLLHLLKGVVTKVTCFPDGVLVSFRPTPGGLLSPRGSENPFGWAEAHIWVNVRNKEIASAGLL